MASSHFKFRDHNLIIFFKSNTNTAKTETFEDKTQTNKQGRGRRWQTKVRPRAELSPGMMLQLKIFFTFPLNDPCDPVLCFLRIAKFLLVPIFYSLQIAIMNQQVSFIFVLSSALHKAQEPEQKLHTTFRQKVLLTTGEYKLPTAILWLGHCKFCL